VDGVRDLADRSDRVCKLNIDPLLDFCQLTSERLTHTRVVAQAVMTSNATAPRRRASLPSAPPIQAHPRNFHPAEAFSISGAADGPGGG
jgi:hypothetical protein